MNINLLKKIGIICASTVGILYVGFLALPFAINGIVKSYIPEINKIIETSTGLKSEITDFKIITTPKLTAGANLKSFKINTPKGKNIFTCDDFKLRLSLLPILAKRIELDKIEAGNIEANIAVEKDGSFELMKYFPQTNNTDSSEEVQPAAMTELPFGIKLSNKLPDIKVTKYSAKFIDNPTKKEYILSGNDFKISDFIINKKIKVSTNGKFDLEGKNQFNYDLKVFNKIMPDMDLNELVFSQSEQTPKTEQNIEPFNIIDIFKTIKNNQLTANLNADITTSKLRDEIHINGKTAVENLSLGVDGKPLPPSSVILNFKQNKIDLISKLHSSEADFTEIIGQFKTGKKPNIDLTFRSKAKFNDLIAIIDSIAKSAGYKDLATLSATGGIDADFNLKSNLKKITSSGYFNIEKSNLRYDLFNVAINNIVANIDFSNNSVKISDSGLEILSQPLKFYGEIKPDATSDLHLTADRLPIKGLLLTAGQIGLLKDNDIAGTVSMDASLTGKLNKPEAKLSLNANNINIKNKPSATSIINTKSTVEITPQNNAFVGDIKITDFRITNPIASVTAKEANVKLDDKNIAIEKNYILLNNSKINYSGKITDYMTNKLAFNISADGGILASDLKTMIPQELRGEITSSGSIPVNFSAFGNLKTQEIKFNAQADKNNHIAIVNIPNLSGQKTILNGNIKISNDSLKLTNTGIFKNSLNTPLVSVKGGIDNLSGNMKLNGLNISTNENISVEIPGFKGSQVSANANISANGTLTTPKIKGQIKLPTISIPTIKTTIKNTEINLSESLITANCPDIAIDNSKMNGSAKISTNFAKGINIKSMIFNAENLDADTLGAAMANLPQPTNTGSTSSVSSSPQDLGITVSNGKGTVTRLKSGGIVGENFTGDFNLKNNTLYINNIKGTAFSGDITGKVSYNIITSAISANIKGDNLNAETAIEGAAGIKKALTGKLKFTADVSLKGLTEKEMMESLKGKVTFGIGEGSLGSIGKLDYILGAQNVSSNSILKAAVNSIAVLPTVQKTAHFKSISGELELNDGWANLKTVEMAGPAMCYFVSGKYNLLTGFANITILGRLSAEIVSALGPLGDLSVSKLTAYIPKFGAATSNLLNALTTNPAGEKTDLIPQLTTGSTNYKDFKVLINGNIVNPSAVKSFKWLSKCDTSEMENLSIKEQVETTKEAIKETYTNKVEATKNKLEAARKEAQTQAQQFKNLKNNLKNLNNIKW